MAQFEIGGMVRKQFKRSAERCGGRKILSQGGTNRKYRCPDHTGYDVQRSKGVPQDDAEAVKWFLKASPARRCKGPVKSGYYVPGR